MLAAGSFDSLKTEVYNDKTSSWKSLGDYPYSGQESISQKKIFINFGELDLL